MWHGMVVPLVGSLVSVYGPDKAPLIIFPLFISPFLSFSACHPLPSTPFPHLPPPLISTARAFPFNDLVAWLLSKPVMDYLGSVSMLHTQKRACFLFLFF